MASMRSNVGKRDPISQDMRLKATLLQRFADVREYMTVVKKVSNYGPVFTAVNENVEPHLPRLYKVWKGEAALEVKDEEMISELEKVVEVLKCA